MSMKILGVEVNDKDDKYSVSVDKKDAVNTAINAFLLYQIFKPSPTPAVTPVIPATSYNAPIPASIEDTEPYIPPKIELFKRFTPMEMKWVAQICQMDKADMEAIKERNKNK